MPLMCCDACSEIDFKPISLGVSCACFCPACKQVSTHTSIAQNYYPGAQKINSQELILKCKKEVIVELSSGCLSNHRLTVMGHSKLKSEKIGLKIA